MQNQDIILYPLHTLRKLMKLIRNQIKLKSIVFSKAIVHFCYERPKKTVLWLQEDSRLECKPCKMKFKLSPLDFSLSFSSSSSVLVTSLSRFGQYMSPHHSYPFNEKEGDIERQGIDIEKTLSVNHDIIIWQVIHHNTKRLI